MNFLLHRHLGARDLDSATAGVGAMLPDLWRMADRRVRPRTEAHAPVASLPLEALLLGVEHHVAADRWFHQSAVFIDGEEEATRRLGEAKLSARRSILFAHVLWELCLDGELVRREGRERIMTAIGDGVRDAGDAMRAAADVHHFTRVARMPEERLAFERRLDRICRELSAGPWIQSYGSGEGIAAIVGAMRRRVGLEPMGPDDLARLAEVARALLERAVDGVDRILATQVPIVASASASAKSRATL
jgi:hypothetical protein